MEINKIYQGDALSVLKTFEGGSINCCVTSPPYWGLRDYGTATWVGGDDKCPHQRENKITTSPNQYKVPSGDMIYKNTCSKCGAIRQDEQLGLEKTPGEYVQKLVEIFREVKRILKPEGTLWLNLGDSYSGGGRGCNTPKQQSNKGTLDMPQGIIPKGLKPKDLVGIPWMVAFALRSDGWYLRQDIIWYKRNPMPESVTDRCTKSHEYIFLLAKSQKYYYDYQAIYEKANYDGRKDIIMKGSEKYQNGYFPTDVNTQSIAVKGHVRWKTKMEGTNYGGDGSGLHGHSGYDSLDNPYIRNKRSVWDVTTKPFAEAHFATFPELLIVDCIKAGCPENGIVLDPFMGAGTTGLVARKLDRNFIGIELSSKYIKIAEKRLYDELGMFL